MKIMSLFFATLLICAGPASQAKDNKESSSTNKSASTSHKSAGTMSGTTSKSGSTSKYESATVTFEKGSKALSSEEMNKLKSAAQNAMAKGEVTKVEVAAWSDKEHPASGELSKADRKLAEERIDSIKSALRQDKLHEHATAYNMAENAHWIGRHIHSSEAELDAAFAKKEKGAMAREDFELIKSEGAPMKAVVIFKVKEK